MVSVLAQYAARFSVRALDVRVDATLLWVGVSLALAAAVLLAFVPRLPAADATAGMGLSNGTLRVTSGTNRRLRVFAVTQIAASFVLLAGAGMLLTTLLKLQATPAGFDTRRVLAINVPIVSYTRPPERSPASTGRWFGASARSPACSRWPSAPWCRGGRRHVRAGFQFSAEGYARAGGEEDPRARFRTVTPGFFAALGVPVIAGRDFTDADRRNSERVVIVSQSLAKRMFPTQDALNRRLHLDRSGHEVHRREHRAPSHHRRRGRCRRREHRAGTGPDGVPPAGAGDLRRPPLRSRAHDPYALVPPITRIVRALSPDQPVEQAATLDDVRAEVLAPDRLNALVFGVFAGVALLIAVVGVAGVLAFSVSARTREFGIRLAIGSEPRHLLARVLGEGVWIAAAGVLAGVVGGGVLARVVGAYVMQIRMPGTPSILAAAAILVAAAVVASLLPAARAAKVDVIQALRAE